MKSRARVIAGTLVLFSCILVVVAIVAARRSDHSPAIASPLHAALDAAVPASAPFAGWTEARVAVGRRCLRVVVADSLAERERGLMERTELGPYDGMLFVSPGTSSDAFTMSDTRVPLDIGWYDASGRRVDHATMVPCRGDVAHCPIYRPRRSWRFALETLQHRLPAGSLGGCA